MVTGLCVPERFVWYYFLTLGQCFPWMKRMLLWCPLDNSVHCPRYVLYRDGFGFGRKRPGMDQLGTNRHGVRVAYSRWSVHVLPFTEHALPFLREQDLFAKQNSTVKK
jgi:hypothetical protein